MAAHLCRLFLLLAASVVGTNVAHAQSSPGGVKPAPCQASSGEPLAELEKRRQTLEREVARKTAAKTPEGAKNGKEVEENLRKSQEQLLEMLFQIDCLKAPPATTRSISRAAPDSVIEVTTYYATNRKKTTSAEPTALYGPEAETTFHYGRATVTIPPTHTRGNLELPSLWKLEREADPTKHFVLKAVTPLDGDAARKEMTEKLQGMGSKALLVFVHGYNSGFAEAALRTAQLAYDLKFPGLAFFYSWPSAAKVLAYWQDEEMALLSEGVFEQLLGELSQLPFTDIYIVAHSMGNRIVTSALRSRVDKKEETKHIRELLLAAPDINATLFRTVIAPKLAAMQGTRITVYASSSDLALKASKIVHGFRRVGETTEEVFTYPGFDTIDASAASTMARAYGHSYLMDSQAVIKDIEAAIGKKAAAKRRGLSETGSSPNEYWRLQ